MKSKIFISSTCYDLIDLRAELEAELNDMGLLPILSDSLSSEFELGNDTNSIETCLINLKQCDYVLLILSQRYGPSLLNAGFEDISATHLEYRTAVAEKIPILVYVRDKLEAELSIFQKHKENPKGLKWIDSKDIKIFELLLEHKKLINDQKNNWYWIFRNSLELKQRVRIDLKKISGKSIINSLIKSGQSPLITVETISHSFLSNQIRLKINIRNVGTTVALEPVLINYDIKFSDFEKVTLDELITETPNNKKLKSIESSETQEHTLMFTPEQFMNEGTQVHLPIEIFYTTIQGIRVSDITKLTLDFNSNSRQITRALTQYQYKRFVLSDAFNTM